MDLPTDLFGDLSPEDAIQLRTISRALHADAQNYAIAIAFASTRVAIGGVSLTLRKWCDIWDACAAAVTMQNMKASSWAYAIEWLEFEPLEHLHNSFSFCKCPYVTAGYELDPRCAAPIIDRMIMWFEKQSCKSCIDAGHLPSVLIILALTGGHTRIYCKVHALVILSDGRLAVASGHFCDTIGIWNAVVRFEKDLSALAAMFVQDSGGRLRIKQDIPASPLAPMKQPMQWRKRRLHPHRRRAADGAAYEHIEFMLWYAIPHIQWHGYDDDVLVNQAIAYAQKRWDEARPCSPRGDYFAAMVNNNMEVITSLPVPASLPIAPKDLPEDPTIKVIQFVDHHEIAAEIDTGEAEEVVALQSGSYIRTIADSIEQTSIHSEEVEEQEPLYLCKLNRMTKSLRSALCEGKSLQQCRAALDAEGHNWQLPGGALVFVQPWQFRPAMRAICSTEQLRPDHLIISASMDHLVQETLEMSNRSSGAWVKRRHQLQTVDTDSVDAISSQLDLPVDDAVAEFELVYSRAFLSFATKLRPAAGVSQSTTEADSRNGLNPRRAQGYRVYM